MTGEIYVYILLPMTATLDRSERTQLRTVAATCVNLGSRKAARALTQRYDDALRPAGIRSTQFSLLVVVALRQPVTLNALADAAVVDRTTLTRSLTLLVRDGLITITPGGDRRTREVRLTGRGRAVLQRALPLWERTQRAIAEAIGPQHVSRVLHDLAALVQAAQPA